LIPLIYHPIYSALPLPDGHRYPIRKYELLYEAVAERYSNSSLFRFVEPQALSVADIKQTHCHTYTDNLVSGLLPAAKMRRIGFPWSEKLIERTLTSTGGTVLAVKEALENGLAIHLSGGYHHAHFDYGSGFCLFNDLAVAAQHAILQGVDKVLIVDSDVHHGDGTASLMAQNSQIITLSLHCDKNFPARKPDSDFDVPFTKGAEDDDFLPSFKQVVQFALDIHQPDMVIFDAGVDIHQDDELGFLNVTLDGIRERDHWMLATCQKRNIPIACVIGGGYRSNHADLVPIHMSLIEAAAKLKELT
jgi:acetoin utilization deacetylase AcuC-like enzyme